jgi:hypothetical protein
MPWGIFVWVGALGFIRKAGIQEVRRTAKARRREGAEKWKLKNGKGSANPRIHEREIAARVGLDRRCRGLPFIRDFSVCV